MLDISEIRKSINSIDDQILALLSERTKLYKDVAQFKFNNGKNITDNSRENAHLHDLMLKAEKLSVNPELVSNIYDKIFEDSRAHQNSYIKSLITENKTYSNHLTIAFLGEEGTYSYLASYKYFNYIVDKVTEKHCKSFQEIVDSVENNEADFALLPIENSSSGCINEVYDILQETNTKIVGELTYPIEHCLLSSCPTDLSQVTQIFAHPQPLSQCANFIKEKLPNAKLVNCTSSSDAMKKVKALNSPNAVAIGCKEAGELYELAPIASKIANQKYNITRFIVINKNSISVPSHIPAKTSIIFTAPNIPGSLVKVLQLFSSRNINVVKIQSRPLSSSLKEHMPWDENFYADIHENISSPTLIEALNELKEISSYVRVLGCYPREIKD